jgi:hypothetical protein
MPELDHLTELSSRVYLEDHPKFGLTLWHKKFPQREDYDHYIELNDRAEEKLLELLQARKEAREHQARIAEVAEMVKKGNTFAASAFQVEFNITDDELNAAVNA